MAPLITLSQNITLLLALTFVYGFIYPSLRRFSRPTITAVNAILFSTFALISMTQPLHITPGFFLDGRTVVVVIATLYAGPVEGLTAAIMVCLYRAMLGGVGVVPGIGAALTVALLSLLARDYLLRRGQKYPTNVQLFLGGVILSLVGGVWALIAFNFNGAILPQTMPFTLLIYPLGMLLLGGLLTSQRRSRETEEALHASERRFHAIFDTMFNFIGLLKPDGTLLEANQTALDFIGATRADVVGRPYWETPWWTISPETQAQLHTAILKAAAGEFVRYEVEVWGANHQVMTIDFSLKPIRDEHGQVVLLIPEGHDISERKQYENQKVELVFERERSQILKRFISDVSHDLRTPLAVIRLNVDLISRLDKLEQVQRRVQTLADQERHLSRLLENMMIMLTLDDPASTLMFQPTDINQAVQIIFDVKQSAAEKNDLTLAFNPAPYDVWASSSPELQRAITNVLSNALTYTPQYGRITLSTCATDREAIIEVSDTGIGIAEADLPQIFNRFYRADSARSMDSGGAGLGLSISKRIVELNGGRIEVESKVNQGSTFRIVLPLTTPDGSNTRSGITIREPAILSATALY